LICAQSSRKTAHKVGAILFTMSDNRSRNNSSLSESDALKETARAQSENTYMYMRMRTPSPENTYRGYTGRALPPQAETLVEYSPVAENNLEFAPQYMLQPYVICQPVLCFMPTHPSNGSFEDWQHYTSSDEETAMGQSYGFGEWQSFPTWMSSQSSEASTTTPDADEDSCKVCLPEDKLAGVQNEPSAGSLNHPHSCADACKYIRKPRGCKDGVDCVRCHLCTYAKGSTQRREKKYPHNRPLPGARQRANKMNKTKLGGLTQSPLE